MGCDKVCFSGVTQCGMLYWGPVIVTSSGAVCGLMAIVCIMTMRSRLNRRRHEMDMHMHVAQATQDVRLSQAQQFRERTQRVLEEIVPFEYDEKDGASMSFSNSTCSICLGEFESGEELRRLQCQHCFHSDCVASWLNVKHTCPLCVAPVSSSVNVTTARPPRPPVEQAWEGP